MKTASMLNADGNLLSWFEESCRESAESTAVETVNGSVSYSELQSRVGRVSVLLEQIQLGTGDRAVVLVRDRVELIATMIALFERGEMFIPLDWEAPDARIKAILSNAHPSVILTDGSLEGDNSSIAKRFGLPCPLVHIHERSPEKLRPVSKKPKSYVPMHERAANAPAYIYYTSGSTGKPNGVVGSLRAVSQYIAWEVKTFSLERGPRVSQLSSPTFDPFFRDVFVPLSTGGTVVVPPNTAGRMTPEDLSEWITRCNIQIVHTVPTILAALANSDPSSGGAEALRCLFVAGETLYASVVRRFWDRFGISLQTGVVRFALVSGLDLWIKDQ